MLMFSVLSEVFYIWKIQKHSPCASFQILILKDNTKNKNFLMLSEFKFEANDTLMLPTAENTGIPKE